MHFPSLLEIAKAEGLELPRARVGQQTQPDGACPEIRPEQAGERAALGSRAAGSQVPALPQHHVHLQDPRRGPGGGAGGALGNDLKSHKRSWPFGEEATDDVKRQKPDFERRRRKVFTDF